MSVIGYQRVTSVRSLQSNLQLIIQYLSSLGYATVYEKLKATDYGLPQRRNRIYFFGVRDSHELAEKKEDILSKVSDRLVGMQQKCCRPIASCMQHMVQSGLASLVNDVSCNTAYKEEFLLDGDIINAELARRTKDASSGDKSADKDKHQTNQKWRDVHSAMAEQSARLSQRRVCTSVWSLSLSLL